MLLVHAGIAALIVLLLPGIAHAWGPGMHVEIALTALGKAALAAPFIAELMRRFPDAFIYGSASPDIIVGKKYAGYLHHCHNWRMGKKILAAARSDRQRAAAWGYLMHLAADVVAHNYYIPVKIVRSYDARVLAHTYWEMRFDLGVRDESWERLDMVTELDIEEFDKLLERVLRRTLFSFSTNKRIFNTILILQKMRGLRASLRLYAAHSRFGIAEENRQHYVDLATEAALDFLKDPDSAPSLQMDPAGLDRLDYAKKLRKKMRSMMSRGAMSRKQAETLVEVVKDSLALGLYRSDMKLPAVTDVV
ncbi:MAG: zinc dependent phospholipase C family protein [bacterium]